MLVTRLRHLSGYKFKPEALEMICKDIVDAQAKAGFVTEAYVVNSTSIKIGLRMRSFVIDPRKLGYNAKMGIHINSKKGYKRTITPTWEQREAYNHIVNKILNAYDAVANVRSGEYVVRTVENGAVKEWDCLDAWGNPAIPNTVTNGFGEVVDRLMSEREAITTIKKGA